MIDFVHQIDLRLREFQRLTGKGNIKDCHQILYEIIRLLVAMINQPPEQIVMIESSHAPLISDPAPSTSDIIAPYGFTRHGNPQRKSRGKNRISS